jgi:coenzyme F420-0:L-glutamate ligase
LQEMNKHQNSLTMFGIRTPLIQAGDDLATVLAGAFPDNGVVLEDGDIIILAESAVATAEGRLVNLAGVEPGEQAVRLAHRFSIDPREMELVLRECDEVFGGVTGAVLTITNGNLAPNAGIDSSNAPEGHVVLLPGDAQQSAGNIRRALQGLSGCRLAGVIIDSRTQPLRLGCTGVALGTSGMIPVEDARGEPDLFGKPLHITHRATADNLASAAQLLMGEAGEGIPCVIVRGAPVRVIDEDIPMPLFSREECMYFSNISGFREDDWK